MNSTRPDAELDLSGFLAAHRAMRVGVRIHACRRRNQRLYGAVQAEPRNGG